jgi:hypothetical protein
LEIRDNRKEKPSDMDSEEKEPIYAQRPVTEKEQFDEQNSRYWAQFALKKNTIKNDSKFWIAATIILGMMIILTITVLEGQFSQTQQLAGIFSGWVTSIIAFYFLGQTTQQAQSQIKDSTQSQVKAENKAETLDNKLKRIEDLISIPETFREANIETYQAMQQKIRRIINGNS